jgi:hypothetical protein
MADFDSTIRRVESSRPSQALTQLKMVCNYITKSQLNTGFPAFFAASSCPENSNLREKFPKVSSPYA